MTFLQTFQFQDFLDTLVSLTAAFIFGTIIGAERQYRQRSAGLRTNVLVCLGAAAFVDLAYHLDGPEGSVRVIAYVVSGIGFLGAGVIMKEGANIRGLNTAATLWASAAVGACAGADMIAQSAVVTLFVIAANTMLRPLVHAIDRIPLDEATSEANYEIIVTTSPSDLSTVREALSEKLETACYPVRNMLVSHLPERRVEVTAVLATQSAVADELDKVTEELAQVAGITHATWSSRVTD